MDAYETLKSETVFTGKFIEVVQDTIVLPDGKEAVREIVLHSQGSAILPVDNEGNIIFVRQYRHAAGTLALEVPAGVFDTKDEASDVCAMRELEEETGYKAGKLTYMTMMYASIGFCDEKIHLYLAEDLIESKMNLDEEEFISLERYSLSEAVEMVFNGKIVDSKTMLAILAYKSLKN